ncbi:MAG: SMP-30/gluconolactonase/LRE family protein [Verrucomicrobiota bacterium]|nr:SMP-30/gluconolactonase/LRE family protein [Verrucomicrobiota bacterium]
MKPISCLFLVSTLFSVASISAAMFPETVTPVSVTSGLSSLEGPAWDPTTQTIYFSNQNSPFGIYSYTQAAGRKLFKSYTGKVNGNAIDLQGRLVTCESGARTIARYDKDGNRSVLVSAYNGFVLNEPNDIVVKSDGTIWFTTPTWENNDAAKSRQFVLCYDPVKKTTTAMVSGIDKPNGLAFSPDEKTFYLNDNELNRVLAYDVGADNSLSGMRVLISGLNKWPDGITVDAYGNLVIALFDGANKGVVIYSPQGELLKTIPMAANTTNVEFGGANKRTLYITSGGALFSVAFPALEFEAPAAPTALKSNLLETGVVLTWQDTAEDELGFIIERSLDGQTYSLLAKVNTANLAEYTDTTTVSGTHYTYHVHAYNAAGNSLEGTATCIQPGNDFYYGNDLGDDTRATNKLGTILVSGPWVWSEAHSWWYIHPLGRNSFFLYDFAPELGWLWSGESFYPYLYSFKEGCWLYYYSISEKTRWFARLGNESDPWLLVTGA